MRDEDGPGGGPGLEALIHRADPAELLAEVEAASARRDWDGLLVLRDRCDDAAGRLGKQLWPIAHYVEYRLALEAPGPLAATVVRPGAARFALGPLTEVVATHHRWDELAEHLGLPVIAATVAQERVVRGEDLRGDPRAEAVSGELELPLVLQDWEPDYPLPAYRVDELLEHGPTEPERPPVTRTDVAPAPPEDAGERRPPSLTSRGVERAVEQLIGHWASASTGRVHVATLAGDAAAAVAAFVPGEFSLTTLYLDEALEQLVWAAASGGARGRRRGIAAGRSAMWWLAHRLTGLDHPADPDRLGDLLDGFGWYLFTPQNRGTAGGWTLRLAIEHPGRARTTVVDAEDAVVDADRNGAGSSEAVEQGDHR